MRGTSTAAWLFSGDVFIADSQTRGELRDASDRVGRHVRTIRSVAKILGQFLFAAIGRHEPGLDRYARHASTSAGHDLQSAGQARRDGFYGLLG